MIWLFTLNSPKRWFEKVAKEEQSVLLASAVDAAEELVVYVGHQVGFPAV